MSDFVWVGVGVYSVVLVILPLVVVIDNVVDDVAKHIGILLNGRDDLFMTKSHLPAVKPLKEQ